MAASGQVGASGGMILLEPGNRIIAEVVRDKIARAKNTEEKADAMDIRLCDFDDVAYRIFSEKDTPNTVNVKMDLPSWRKLKEVAGEHLQSVFGDALSYDGDAIVVTFDCTKLENEAAFVEKVSRLRAHAVGGVFQKYFNALKDGKLKELKSFQYDARADTDVYIVPRDGALTIIYSLEFRERVDRACARVFLTEFAESRRHLGAAPPCTFNDNPPLELKEFGITEPKGGKHVGFVSFTILPSHVDTKHNADKINQGVNAFALFRNFLLYHIKCSKAYFHSRMRARVVSLLQVLNRAKSEEESKEKKTITGRTFVRK